MSRLKRRRRIGSSFKPFQSVPVPPPRIGCRMMCSLAACPLRHVPPSPCLLAASSFASLIRLVLSPRRSCRASLRPVSSHPLVLPALAMLAYSLRLPPRSSCRRAGRPSSRSHLVMRLACRLCVLACRHAFRSPSWRDLRMSSPRACVPLLPCRPASSRLSPRLSCRVAGRC